MAYEHVSASYHRFGWRRRWLWIGKVTMSEPKRSKQKQVPYREAFERMNFLFQVLQPTSLDYALQAYASLSVRVTMLAAT